MSPKHHPGDDILLEYAAGSLSEHESLLIAAHATFCAGCRDALATLEEAAASRMASLPVEAVSPDMLDRLLAQLPDQDEVPAPRPQPGPNSPVPSAVWDYLDPPHELRWRFLAPGIRQIPLALQCGEMPVRLIELAPGLNVPSHTHAGLERTVVLQGGYSDDHGDFVAGDYAARDGSGVHRQRIHKGTPCIALVAADHAIVPVGVFSTVLSWFIRA